MAIDAVIDSVQQHPNGDILLRLISRDPQVAPAGQPYLTIIKKPTYVPKIGMAIWGGSGQVILEAEADNKRVYYDRITTSKIQEREISNEFKPFPPDQLAV